MPKDQDLEYGKWEDMNGAVRTGLALGGGVGLGASSFPSKRLDIEPLCQLLLELPGVPGLGAESAPADAVPAMYIAALPLPGRAAGKRFTMTEEDRGMICWSFLNSTERRGTKWSVLGALEA